MITDSLKSSCFVRPVDLIEITSAKWYAQLCINKRRRWCDRCRLFWIQIFLTRLRLKYLRIPALSLIVSLNGITTIRKRYHSQYIFIIFLLNLWRSHWFDSSLPRVSHDAFDDQFRSASAEYEVDLQLVLMAPHGVLHVTASAMRWVASRGLTDLTDRPSTNVQHCWKHNDETSPPASCAPEPLGKVTLLFTLDGLLFNFLRTPEYVLMFTLKVCWQEKNSGRFILGYSQSFENQVRDRPP